MALVIKCSNRKTRSTQTPMYDRRKGSCPLQYNLIREILEYIHDDLRYTLEKKGLGDNKDAIPSKLSLRAILNAGQMDYYSDLLLGTKFRGETLWILAEKFEEYSRNVVPWLIKNKCPYIYGSNRLKIYVEDANVYGTYAEEFNYSSFKGTSYNYRDYEGDFMEGKMNGNGKCEYIINPYEKDVYEGNFKNNLRNGYGRLKSCESYTYEGNWTDDEINGYGKMIFYSLRDDLMFMFDYTQDLLDYSNYVVEFIYEGNWKNNVRNGNGKYTSSNGLVTHGHWIDGKFQNNGSQIWPNGDSYSGDFSIVPDHNCISNQIYSMICRRHGHGQCNYANGIVYNGQWMNDKRHGQGYQIWPDGRIYKGEWSNDSPGLTTTSSNGRYSYPDGRSYDGIFVNGKLVTLNDMEP